MNYGGTLGCRWRVGSGLIGVDLLARKKKLDIAVCHLFSILYSCADFCFSWTDWSSSAALCSYGWRSECLLYETNEGGSPLREEIAARMIY